MKRIITAVLVAIVALVACGPAEQSGEDGPVVERETVGDTTIVRTLSGSEWSEPRHAVEQLRIGTLEGPDETMFGYIAEMTPDGAGGVFLFDSQVPAIRHFDGEGVYLGQVGREGEGPGEYLDALLGMQVRGDGRLQVWDPRNGRITVYEPDGSFSDQWSVSSSLFTGDAMLLDDNDHTYVRYLEKRPQPGEDWAIGLLQFGPDGGSLESLPTPEVDDPPPSGNHFLKPSVHWTRTPEGAWVVGSTASYEFDIRSPDGSTIRIQRAIEPLALGEEEHAAYEARRAWMIENQGQFMSSELTETPRMKPAYRSLHVGAGGRVWVYRYAPVRPREDVPAPVPGRPPPFPFEEPKVYDVFEADGTYLGEAITSPEVTLHHLDLEEAWGVRTGDDGTIYVVRLRFVPERET